MTPTGTRCSRKQEVETYRTERSKPNKDRSSEPGGEECVSLTGQGQSEGRSRNPSTSKVNFRPRKETEGNREGNSTTTSNSLSFIFLTLKEAREGESGNKEGTQEVPTREKGRGRGGLQKKSPHRRDPTHATAAQGLTGNHRRDREEGEQNSLSLKPLLVLTTRTGGQGEREREPRRTPPSEQEVEETAAQGSGQSS